MNSTATIDLKRLCENYGALRLPNVDCACVVKADAYGHGAVRCARALWEAGAQQFCVANLQEAVAMRRALPDAAVLILGQTPPQYADLLCRHRLSQCVFSLSYARALSARLTRPLSVHFKVDTGMHRLGFPCDETGVDAICRAARLPNLALTGIFTHPADIGAQSPQNQAQWQRFAAVVDALLAQGLSFRFVHAQNSAAHDAYLPFCNLIRLGIALYGYPPFELRGIAPVLSWQTRIVALVRVQKGETVGYVPSWEAKRNSRVAVLPIGYADGLRRDFCGASVSVGTADAKLISVCMDLCMIDVTECADAKEGTAVQIIGNRHTASDLAAQAQEIPYAVLCGIGKRVRRVYRT